MIKTFEFMANYSITPDSFSGNNSVQVSGEQVPNTGRAAKQKTVVFAGDGVSGTVKRIFNHAGKPEHITVTGGNKVSASKAGGDVTISGKSNSAKLKIEFVGDALEATIAAQYTAAGKPTNNGEAIEGDPGNSAEYDFSVKITLPANTSVEDVLRTVKISNGSTVYQQVQIEQAEGDAFLTVEPEEEQTMPWNGTPITFTVKSNTTVNVTME